MCVSEHSSDANADPANIIIIVTLHGHNYMYIHVQSCTLWARGGGGGASRSDPAGPTKMGLLRAWTDVRGSVDVWCSTGGLVDGLLALGDKELVESCCLLHSRGCSAVGCR